MKINIKCSEEFPSVSVVRFFTEDILPILGKIKIETSMSNSCIYTKKGLVVCGNAECTVEIFTEIPVDLLARALNPVVLVDALEKEAGILFGELLAIRKIEEEKQNFSTEYFSFIRREA